jgi:hypothetical protein
LNRQHHDYYIVNPVNGGRMITNEEGQAAFGSIDTLPRLELSQATVDVVVPYIEKKLTKRSPDRP